MGTSGLDVTELTQLLERLRPTNHPSGNQLFLAITSLQLTILMMKMIMMITMEMILDILPEDDNFLFLSKLPKRSFSVFWLSTLENTKEQLCSLSIPVFSLLTKKNK